MRRDIIIGDIHGCIDEFVELVETVKLAPGDKVIPVGDIVDKGPASDQVVAYCRKLRHDGFLDEAVGGNHEDKHRRWRRHVEIEARTGKRNPMTDRNGDLVKITPTLTREDIEFLDSMPMFHRLSGGRGLVVHAGISPWLKSLPAVAPTWADRNDILNTCFWIRCIAPNGAAVGLGKEKPEDTYWASSYDGRFGHVFFGHQPFKEPQPHQFQHATALDLGCCYGMHLAAAVVPDDGAVEYVTVKARKQYSTSFFEGPPDLF
jgi:serine/threonine protein phosphatase 1